MEKIDWEDVGICIVQIAMIWVAVYTFRVDRRVALFWMLFCWMMLDKKPTDSQSQKESKDADESIACEHELQNVASPGFPPKIRCPKCRKFFNY